MAVRGLERVRHARVTLGRVDACSPLAGCLAYCGFHDKAHAQAEAKPLREMRLDVDIGGVPAYSTLGWVGDPEPSTMMSWSDANLVGTVLHELGRQRVYIKDDTTFNGSYARFVEQEGLCQSHTGGRIAAVEPEAEKRREAQLVALVIAVRERLADAFAAAVAGGDARTRGGAFAQLALDHESPCDRQWGGACDHDGGESQSMKADIRSKR